MALVYHDQLLKPYTSEMQNNFIGFILLFDYFKMLWQHYALIEVNLINPPVIISIYLFTYLVQDRMRCHVFLAIHLCVFTFYCSICGTQSRDFPRPDLGPNIGPFPIQT